MQHDNVDKDPDLRKKSDADADGTLSPPKPKWWQARWALLIGVPFGLGIGVVVVVVLGWAGVEWFGLTPGNDADSGKASAAGAWASAIGATALAIASVWLALQANAQTRKAEQRSEDEAARVEDRHQKELDAANQRLIDQLDVQGRRDQIRCVAEAYRAYNSFRYESMTAIQEIEVLVESEVSVDGARKMTNLYRKWERAFTEVHNAYAAANLIISNKPTREAAMECDRLANSLAYQIQSMHEETSQRRHPYSGNISKARHLRDELGIAAEELLNAARDNLNSTATIKPTQAPPHGHPSQLTENRDLTTDDTIPP